MNKARNRVLLNEYTEKHHIVPKCMGGTDDKDNIAILTGREHFIAHLFLARMNLSKKYHIQMLHAANAMANKYTQNPSNRQYNSRLYESLKKELTFHLSKKWKGSNNPINNLSEEQKKQWKEKLRSNTTERMKDPIFYAHYKEQQKNAISKPETRKKISEKTKEAMSRPEVRKRYEEGFKSRKIDLEYHRLKTREAMSRPEYQEKMKEFRSIKRKWCNNGEKNKLIPIDQPIPEGWRLGMYRTEEDIERIKSIFSNTRKNKEPWNKGKKGLQKMSIETRKKMSESQKKRIR